MPLWRSKGLWAAGGVGGAFAMALGYDRYRLARIRAGFLEEASRMGAEPGQEVPRKVTLVAFGGDAAQLRQIKKCWRVYAVDLFTRAGCDYQWVEAEAGALDRAVDGLVPVPDGVVLPSDRQPPPLVNAANWIKPSMVFWLYHLNKRLAAPTKETVPSPGQDEGTVAEQCVQRVWEGRRLVPSRARFLADGIVSLDRQSRDAVASGVDEWAREILRNANNVQKIDAIPRLGFIPCDPSPSWRHTVYSFFNRSQIAEQVGTAAMEILRDQPRPMTTRAMQTQPRPAASLALTYHKVE